MYAGEGFDLPLPDCKTKLKIAVMTTQALLPKLENVQRHRSGSIVFFLYFWSVHPATHCTRSQNFCRFPFLSLPQAESSFSASD
jgi:hypothetical protein